MITPGHKRALNQALHELRRPLQALVLMEEGSASAAAAPAASRRGLLELATGALRDLDGALNGAGPVRPPERFSSREVVLGCLERWRTLTARCGGFRVYWDAGAAPVDGDPGRFAQAIENLIANAVEHGGPPIVITGARVVDRLRITIANGMRRDAVPRSTDPRRGHGTRIVSEVASSHGGRFALCQTGSGCVAALELPLAQPGLAHAA
jgi:hypothetical protein